jgi:hypothetical protein
MNFDIPPRKSTTGRAAFFGRRARLMRICELSGGCPFDRTRNQVNFWVKLHRKFSTQRRAMSAAHFLEKPFPTLPAQPA